jgi:hypothetical protein
MHYVRSSFLFFFSLDRMHAWMRIRSMHGRLLAKSNYVLPPIRNKLSTNFVLLSLYKIADTYFRSEGVLFTSTTSARSFPSSRNHAAVALEDETKSVQARSSAATFISRLMCYPCSVQFDAKSPWTPCIHLFYHFHQLRSCMAWSTSSASTFRNPVDATGLACSVPSVRLNYNTSFLFTTTTSG